MKLVSVITVNFNHGYVTEALLHSLQHHNDYPEIEIIVVDNGSDTNPVPGWQAKYPGVRFIRSEVNTGFAGGNNIGIRAAKGDYLFLINNDTEVTETLIRSLTEVMDRHPDVGIISPKIRYFDHPEILQYAGYTKVNYITGRNVCIGQFEQDEGQHDTRSGPTAYAHGAAMMVRRQALDKAGLMTENYFLYYEELDWSERIRRAGYEVYAHMQALIYHKESVSVGKKTALKEYFMNRNRILFVRRFASPGAFIVFCCYFAAVVVPRNIYNYIREGNTHFIPVLFKAIGWHLTHRPDSSDTGYPVKH